MGLIEWNYTESYPNGGRFDGTAHAHAVRLACYRSRVEDPDGPIQLPACVDSEVLFAEPVYQLMRLQLLAWKIEQAGELDADRVAGVHAAPARNEALLAQSLGSPPFARYASTSGGLIAAWKALLRRRYRHLVDPPPATARPAGTSEPRPRPDTLTGEELRELAFDGDISDVWNGRQGGLDGTTAANKTALRVLAGRCQALDVEPA